MDELINNILDDLLITYNKDKKLFNSIYTSLPLDIYIKIEKLSTQKSVTNAELCKKAKKVTDFYHKSIK